MEFLQIILHFEHYLDSVIAQYGALVYLLLFVIVFSEIAIAPLFFLPGNPLIFITGAFCASAHLNIWLVMTVLFSAAFLGSVASYRIGKAVGHKVFSGKYAWLDQASFNKAHAFYERFGGVTFLLSLYVPVVRTFAPLAAGVAEMTFAKFALFAAAGAAAWVGLLVPGGYFFGNIPVIHENLNNIMLAGVGGGVGALLLSGAWRTYRRRRATHDN